MGPPTFTNSALKKASSEVTPPSGGPPTFYRNKTVDERDSDTRKSLYHYLNFFILVNLAPNFVKIKSNGQIEVWLKPYRYATLINFTLQMCQHICSSLYFYSYANLLFVLKDQILIKSNPEEGMPPEMIREVELREEEMTVLTMLVSQEKSNNLRNSNLTQSKMESLLPSLRSRPLLLDC